MFLDRRCHSLYPFFHAHAFGISQHFGDVALDGDGLVAGRQEHLPCINMDVLY